jgi:hypothetical protein
MTVMLGPDVLYRVPIVTAAESVGYVITGRAAERTGVDGDAGGGAFRGVRLMDGTPIPAPPGPFAFAFPRAAIGPEATLHVVWAEPADPKVLDTVPDLRSVHLASLWHAAYHGGTWSTPQRIWETGRVDWEPERGSGLAADASGALHLAFSGEGRDGRWTLTYLRYAGRSWISTEVGSVGPAAYTDLAAGPHGEVAIVYAAAQPDGQGSHPNALFLTRSPDHGASWGKHAVVGTPLQWPAYEPRLAIGGAGDLHVVWKRQHPGSSDTEALWHAVSRDSGTSWAGFESSPAHGTSSGMQAVMDGEGRIHVVLTAYQNRRAEILYATFGAEGWTPLAPLFPGRLGTQPSLTIEGRSRLHLAWIAQPLGAAVPTNPSPGDTIPWFEVAYSTARAPTP